MIRTHYFLCLSIFITTYLMAQFHDFPTLTGPYLGQRPPGMTPIIFAPGIISTEACELHGSFSPDGKEFFFTRRATAEGSDNRLMYTRQQNGYWTKPEPAPFAADCIELFARVSPDAKKVFFLSEKANPITGKLMKNDEKVWFSEKMKAGWSAARFLEGAVNQGWLLSVAVAQNGTLYLSGEFNNQGGIFRSKQVTGQYPQVEHLFQGAHPYIAPDESYVIFDRWDQDGNSALYISFGEQAGKWQPAIMLRPEINTKQGEAFAEVSPDGKYLFFYRDGDIYWVDAKIFKNLQSKEN